jgi:hypothetical protein
MGGNTSNLRKILSEEAARVRGERGKKRCGSEGSDSEDEEGEEGEGRKAGEAEAAPREDALVLDEVLRLKLPGDYWKDVRMGHIPVGPATLFASLLAGSIPV